MALNYFLGCIHDHGGLVHELGTTNLIFRFIAAHPDDQPEYRATLCALALLNSNAAWSQPEAVALAQTSELQGASHAAGSAGHRRPRSGDQRWLLPRH